MIPLVSSEEALRREENRTLRAVEHLEIRNLRKELENFHTSRKLREEERIDREGHTNDHVTTFEAN